jgi:hypothetical protein
MATLSGRYQHGIGLPYPGGVTKKDLEPGLWFGFKVNGLGQLQESFG